jgi:N-formylglutamate amidohydrolase
MAKVEFDPIIRWITGRIGKLVYRRAHNGKVSTYPTPDMSRVRWSQAQKDHRRRLGEASRYAAAVVADPEIRAHYVRMAIDSNRDPRRPSDIASSDYFRNGNDLLWKKHMGDQPKPENWNMERYPWYFNTKKKC